MNVADPMNVARPSPDLVADVLSLAERVVLDEAVPILSQGYRNLVEVFRAAPTLAGVAATDGVDAVLTSDDPAITALYKDNKEFATQAEREAEAAMAARVLTFPEYVVLGEELGQQGGAQHGEGGQEIHFVFDPVDGTTSMLRTAVAEAYGVPAPEVPPAFGVTVGVVVAGQAVAGVVAELRPHRDGLTVPRLWSGGVGAPATRNGQPVSAAPDVSLERAILACTVPEVMFHDEVEWRDFQALSEVTARCVTGQNCIGYMGLLRGADDVPLAGGTPAIDVVFERDLKAPDAAALIPILSAGGVRVSDATGRPLRFGPSELRPDYEYVVLAATANVHAAAMRKLRSGPQGSTTFHRLDNGGVDVAKTGER